MSLPLTLLSYLFSTINPSQTIESPEDIDLLDPDTISPPDSSKFGDIIYTAPGILTLPANTTWVAKATIKVGAITDSNSIRWVVHPTNVGVGIINEQVLFPVNAGVSDAQTTFAFIPVGASPIQIKLRAVIAAASFVIQSEGVFIEVYRVK